MGGSKNKGKRARPTENGEMDKRLKKKKPDTNLDEDSDFETDGFVPKKHDEPKRKAPKRKTSTPKNTVKDICNNEVASSCVLNLGLDPNRPVLQRSSRNILCALDTFTRGIARSLEQRCRTSVVEELSHFEIYKCVSPFDRRTTALAWHPTHPTYVGVGSKGGDVVLWNYESDKFDVHTKGCGPGGSIQNIKFDTKNPSKVYTCSIDGTFQARDFRGKSAKQFLNTMHCDKWYTSFDVSQLDGTLMVGDNNGYVSYLSSRGEEMWRKKLHRSKVTNIEFSPREPWLSVTTSTDNSVKLWDIRALGEGESTPLQVLSHEKAVNAAYFSRMDGTRLLTTDQSSELRIYAAPSWNLERVIRHPHRQFQHLTPIRAAWHPLVDLVVVGRYPDPKFPGYVEGEARSIDIFDADSGKEAYQIKNHQYDKIISLNAFSKLGDALLSGSAGNILVWRKKPVEEEDEENCERQVTSSDPNPNIWPSFKKGSSSNKKQTKKKTKQLE